MPVVCYQQGVNGASTCLVEVRPFVVRKYLRVEFFVCIGPPRKCISLI
jgi:hypothetical protein